MIAGINPALWSLNNYSVHILLRIRLIQYFHCFVFARNIDEFQNYHSYSFDFTFFSSYSHIRSELRTLSRNNQQITHETIDGAKWSISIRTAFMDTSSLVLSKGSRFMRACNFHTGIAHTGRRRKLENIDAQTTEGYRWTRELTLLVLVNSLKARHATACNASRHLRLIKRQTGRCAAASPLLNVSHLSPSFSTFETRRGETGRGVKRRSEAKRSRRGSRVHLHARMSSRRGPNPTTGGKRTLVAFAAILQAAWPPCSDCQASKKIFSPRCRRCFERATRNCGAIARP